MSPLFIACFLLVCALCVAVVGIVYALSLSYIRRNTWTGAARKRTSSSQPPVYVGIPTRFRRERWTADDCN